MNIFEQMVDTNNPKGLRLNKIKSSGTEALSLHLNSSTFKDIISAKIYDKRYDFDFDIVNFPFFEGDVPHITF